MNSKNIYLILPAFNEASVLEKVLAEVIKSGYHIVVVNDGSEDDTAKILEHFPITIINHSINLGQGAALQTGMDWAKIKDAEIVIHFDADGQHYADDVENLLKPVLDGECDLAIGSRFLNSKNAVPFFRKQILRMATFIESIFTGIKLTDAHNGLRALNKKALHSIQLSENRMAHATELISQAKRSNLRIKEVAVRVSYTNYTMQKGQGLLGGVHIIFNLLFKKITK
ncbi:MAG: glycosyltransferase family 2 protein [Bacteroidetes bacterium]|nr:MAG: glycosyltransferase family 2 protein [Bacteroidota bacterium]